MNKIPTTDHHMHSSFSGDSQAPMEDMIQSAVKKGLTHICFTEHIDKDFPTDHHIDFSVDTPAYLKTYQSLSQKYSSQIPRYFKNCLNRKLFSFQIFKYYEALGNMNRISSIFHKVLI